MHDKNMSVCMDCKTPIYPEINKFFLFFWAVQKAVPNDDEINLLP